MPPQEFLQRSDPRLYDLTVTLTIPWNQMKPPSGAAGRPLRWPMLPRAMWSFVDIDSIYVELSDGGQVTKQEGAWDLAKTALPTGQWIIAVPMPSQLSGPPRVQLRLRTNTYSCQFDEQNAARVGWPQQWPPLAQAFLAPGEFIESDHELFTAAVTDALGGVDPRSGPPHLAAKLLIRYCTQNIESSGEYQQEGSTGIRGLAVDGALKAAQAGSGTACDLVCVCVATLRAAGIPARPVIGATNADTVGIGTTAARYMVWGEYWLPGSGWVPFDPKRMAGTVDRVPLADSWQGLGTMPYLNRRIALAHTFVVGGVDQAYDSIGPWSWAPIFKNRPLPVPIELESIPIYEDDDKTINALVPFSPSVQDLQIIFVGTGQSEPPS